VTVASYSKLPGAVTYVLVADLPVEQAAKFALVINHQTARIGLTAPEILLIVADKGSASYVVIVG
jgi:hypothetical protein